eukprot:6241187-Lingulodinium_polyedra.AAC.1
MTKARAGRASAAPRPSGAPRGPPVLVGLGRPSRSEAALPRLACGTPRGAGACWRSRGLGPKRPR